MASAVNLDGCLIQSTFLQPFHSPSLGEIASLFVVLSAGYIHRPLVSSIFVKDCSSVLAIPQQGTGVFTHCRSSYDPHVALNIPLVELPVELIITAPPEPTLAAKQATSTIPVVFVQVADPVRSGIVTNLARPDANVTGMSALATDIAGKRLALIKEALPNTKLISVLWNRPSKGAA
jgi:ABC transporter substrate binding protein